jgi:hypothetical protein
MSKPHRYSGVLATPYVGIPPRGKGLLGFLDPPEMTDDEKMDRIVALVDDLGLVDFDFKEQGHEAFWREMLTRLARRHVPGFRPQVKSGGAPRKWTYELRRKLLMEVEAKQATGLSEPAACRALARKTPYRELGRGSAGLKPETLLRQLQRAKADRKCIPPHGFFGLGRHTNALAALHESLSAGGLLGNRAATGAEDTEAKTEA